MDRAKTTAQQISNSDIFHDSLQRATQEPKFFDRFYARFMRSSPDVALLFSAKDMMRIKQKLKTTLEMVTDNADRKPGVDMYLELLGHLHRRMAITPEMFAHWRMALIDTAAECDRLFDASTRHAWEEVVDLMIAKMGEMSQTMP